MGVFEQVPQLGLALLADRGLQGHRLLCDLEEPVDLLGLQAHLHRQLAGVRLAAQLLAQPVLDAHQLSDQLGVMGRDADGPGVVEDGALDGLSDPPGRIGGELEPASVIELLDRPHQAQVPLLDQVQQRETAPDILLGH